MEDRIQERDLTRITGTIADMHQAEALEAFEESTTPKERERRVIRAAMLREVVEKLLADNMEPEQYERRRERIDKQFAEHRANALTLGGRM